MDVLTLLRQARDAGLTLKPDGDKLVVHGPKKAEPLVMLLRDHKQAVIAALHRQRRRHDEQHAWTPEDWRDYYGERAAIMEYDGRLSRAEAERRAWRETANRWWHEHGSRAPAGLCVGCGKPVALAQAIPLPHAQRAHDADCVKSFGRRWLKEAAAALAAMGIPAPAGYAADDE